MIALPDDGRYGWWRTISTGVLIGVAAIMIFALFDAAGTGRLGHDFRASYLPASEAILQFGSPYATSGGEDDIGRLPYVYPPPLAIALVPLTALPVDVAAFLAFLVSLAAVMGALAVVGVTDLRCYAAVIAWQPGWNALEMANASAALALALALVWRFRATVWPLAIVVALAVSTKLFLWPLLVWAVATRRFRAAGLAAAIGLAITLTAWAAIGFDGLTSYPNQVAKAGFEDSFSIVAMTAVLGYKPIVGHVLMVIVGGALLGTLVRMSRRGNEVGAFTCAIAAAFVLTPIVWQHYLVLLVVPLALARPRFSALWLLPIVLWASKPGAPRDGLEPFLPALVVVVLLFILLARPRGDSVTVEVPA